LCIAVSQATQQIRKTNLAIDDNLLSKWNKKQQLNTIVTIVHAVTILGATATNLVGIIWFVQHKSSTFSSVTFTLMALLDLLVSFTIIS